MKYRKKPVVIEVIKWTGDNYDEIKAFCGESFNCWWFNYASVSIRTLEGDMTASKGDWIIKGVKGEFYPIKNDIFAATYEPVDECE
jgi:hypothetical protein